VRLWVFLFPPCDPVVVLGPTGVGKSYVASALPQKACREGYLVYYTRTAALFRDLNLNLARADSSLRQLLKRLNRIDVLVIDDWDDDRIEMRGESMVSVWTWPLTN
jgi:DNA replication protein DnaC